MAKDFILDSENDLLLKDGDLVFEDADAQNLQAILMINPGGLIWQPLLGSGLIRLTNGKIDPQRIIRDINVNLKSDGWKNIKINIQGTEIKVDATR
jgi:hypothetical protein